MEFVSGTIKEIKRFANTEPSVLQCILHKPQSSSLQQSAQNYGNIGWRGEQDKKRKKQKLSSIKTSNFDIISKLLQYNQILLRSKIPDRFDDDISLQWTKMITSSSKVVR